MSKPTVAAAALGVLLWVTLPRQTAIPLLFAVAAPSVRNALRGIAGSHTTVLGIYAVLGTFSLYLLANAFWSDDVTRALLKAVVVGSFFCCAYLAVQTINNLQHCALRALGFGLCLGTAFAAAYLCIDILCSRIIWAGVRTAVLRAITPDAPSNIGPYGTSQQYVYPYVLNLGFAAFSAFLFPLLLVGRAFISCAWRNAFMVMSITLACLLVLISDHEASKVALLLGATVFFAFPMAPTLVRAATVAGWIAATLLVVPITHAAYSLGLHYSPFVPFSMRGRIVLWKYTGAKVMEAPIFGIGIGSTAVRVKNTPQDGEIVPGTDIFLSTSNHAHNFFLQTWFELGAVGATLLLVIGLLAFKRMNDQPTENQRYLFTAFIVISVLAGSTFNLFAEWWIATIILAALIGCLGTRLFVSVPTATRPGSAQHHDASYDRYV